MAVLTESTVTLLLYLSFLVHGLPNVFSEQEIEYTLVKKMESYKKARMMCRLFGGTLAIINDNATLKTVSDIMTNQWLDGLHVDSRDPWIGLYWTEGGDAMVKDDHFCPKVTNMSETLFLIENEKYMSGKFCYQLEKSQLVLDVCDNTEFYICQRILNNNCTTNCNSAKIRTSYSINEPGDCPEHRTWIPTVTDYETMTTTISKAFSVISTVTEKSTLVSTQNITVTRTETEIVTSVIGPSILKLVETLTISACESKSQPISLESFLTPMTSFSECSTVTVTSPFNNPESCTFAPSTADYVSIPLSQASSVTLTSVNETNTSFTWTCRYIPIVDYESDSAFKAINSIQDKLKVDKEILSRILNKKVSRPDHRPSAVAIGTVGLVFMGSVLGVMLILDFTRLSSCLRNLKNG